MTPITLPQGNFLVAKPAAGLPTSAIFSDPALKRDSDTAILSGFSANPFGFGRNDLQRVAQRICPGVTQALDWLASLGLSGRMTGSGSAVFAHLDQPLKLESAPASIQTRVCSNLGVHPLSGWAPA
jgi:4-diphosphocytidyl-2-C-methyl-D-erythritol kinase